MKNSCVNVGLIGLGRAGCKMHLPEIKATNGKFDVTAVCDIDASRHPEFEKRLGHTVRFYSAAEDLVNDPDIELVSIAVPSKLHTPYAILALNAGKFVFIEKPIAQTVAESKKLAEAAQAHPGKLFLRHNGHFTSEMLEMEKIVNSGILGEIFEIRFRNLSWNRRCDWQAFRECGGGQINNFGPHKIEQALRFLGAPVARIFSKLRKVVSLGNADDHFNLILEGTNGRLIDIEVSDACILPEPNYSFYGSKGAMQVNGGKVHLKYLDPSFTLECPAASKATPAINSTFGNPEKLEWIEEEYPMPNTLGIEEIWYHLYDAIREEKPYPVTLERGLEVVRITELAKRGTEFEVIDPK